MCVLVWVVLVGRWYVCAGVGGWRCVCVCAVYVYNSVYELVLHD